MNKPTHATPQRNMQAELRIVALSLFVGVLLMAIKFLAYYVTRSAAIFSDAMENVVNVLTSGFAVYAVLLAHRPADDEHPYGHGKVEFLSAGFEGGMLFLASVLILVRAVEALALGQTPHDLGLGLVITIISTVLCAVTGLLLRQRGISTGSITLEADGVHLLSDAVTGLVVLIALLAVRWTHQAWIDPAAAVVVCVWIAVQAGQLLRRSAAGLMDEQDAADTALLKQVLDRHIYPAGIDPQICSYHKVRHRHSGRHHWVDFHVQVPGEWDVEQGHRVASDLESAIQAALVDCSATAHVEPCVGVGCGRCKIKSTTAPA